MDWENHERERQAEITRLRLEARKAGREANFNGAALALGLAERNRALLHDKYVMFCGMQGFYGVPYYHISC